MDAVDSLVGSFEIVKCVLLHGAELEDANLGILIRGALDNTMSVLANDVLIFNTFWDSSMLFLKLVRATKHLSIARYYDMPIFAGLTTTSIVALLLFVL